jgi:hypothetical protein
LRRDEDAGQCLLIVIGVTPEGKKELVTIGPCANRRNLGPMACATSPRARRNYWPRSPWAMGSWPSLDFTSGSFVRVLR